MATFRKTVLVNTPVDRAWDVIGDLTFMGKMGGATEVKLQGFKRICTFADGHVQNEEITNYDTKKRSYNYRIEGSPLPVKNNRGKFKVQKSGPSCTIVWDAEFDPLDPAQAANISQMWEGAMEQVLGSIKQRVEGKK